MNSFNRRLLHGASVVILLAAGSQARAQFDAEAHGVVDFSWGRFEPSGLYRAYRFNSNSLTPSFIGGSIRYGLEGGWTVGANLETFVRFQDMRTGRSNSDPDLSRNNFGFVNSPYGNVRAGRLQTLLFDTTGRFNAMGNSIAFSPAVRHVFASGNLMGIQGDFYWNQALAYTSPNLAGFTVNVMQARGDQQEPANLSGGNVVWQRGLFSVALSGQRVYADNGVDDPTSERTWQLAASYNFGVARLFGVHTQTQDVGLMVKSRLSSAGALVPLGPGNVLGQVGYGHARGLAVERVQRTWSLGYVYPWDSQIDLYTLFMNDRIEGQTPGKSAAVGVRWRFQ